MFENDFAAGGNESLPATRRGERQRQEDVNRMAIVRELEITRQHSGDAERAEWPLQVVMGTRDLEQTTDDVGIAVEDLLP